MTNEVVVCVARWLLCPLDALWWEAFHCSSLTLHCILEVFFGIPRCIVILVAFFTFLCCVFSEEKSDLKPFLLYLTQISMWKSISTYFSVKPLFKACIIKLLIIFVVLLLDDYQFAAEKQGKCNRGRHFIWLQKFHRLDLLHFISLLNSFVCVRSSCFYNSLLIYARQWDRQLFRLRSILSIYIYYIYTYI